MISGADNVEEEEPLGVQKTYRSCLVRHTIKAIFGVCLQTGDAVPDKKNIFSMV